MNATTTPTTTTNGRVAIVTGGTANLGKLFAESLAGDDVKLVVHYNSSRRADEAAAVVSELEARGTEAIAHQGDLTDIAAITRLVDATIEHFGKWDILVNTSGLIVRKPLAETTEKEYDDSFAINSKIPFFLMREAFAKMADDGRIINIVTTQVAVTAATYSAYAGSKGPVEHFTKAFAKEIGPRGITVNCIAPGISAFEAATSQLPDADGVVAGNAVKRLGTSRELYESMVYLCSEAAASWVTGQTLRVDGGAGLAGPT
jgi:NAD(P)-dependent dehydrogenase (short-subunit alcohol dehydrogenase family)